MRLPPTIEFSSVWYASEAGGLAGNTPPLLPEPVRRKSFNRARASLLEARVSSRVLQMRRSQPLVRRGIHGLGLS